MNFLNILNANFIYECINVKVECFLIDFIVKNSHFFLTSSLENFSVDENFANILLLMVMVIKVKVFSLRISVVVIISTLIY